VAILVTGAGGLVGRSAVAALLRQGVEHVRAVIRDPAQVGDLRRLGAKVAVLDATDPDGVRAAMGGVFTACSLTGGLWTRPDEDPYAAVVDPAQVFLAAAQATGVRRLVVCSPAAVASPGAVEANPHLAAKAEVERMVAGSGLEHAILRCTHVLGPGGRLVGLLAGGTGFRPESRPGGLGAADGGLAGGRGDALVPVPGDGRQLVAPVWVGDVAAAIAAADDAVELTATWSLAGPDQVSFDDLVDAVHGAPVAKQHLGLGPAGGDGGGAARSFAGLPPAQLEVLAAASLPDPGLPAPPGLVPTPLAEALARSTGPVRPGVAGPA
jgi:uncharacterized protein YbjT (DUF2867 family)